MQTTVKKRMSLPLYPSRIANFLKHNMADLIMSLCTGSNTLLKPAIYPGLSSKAHTQYTSCFKVTQLQCLLFGKGEIWTTSGFWPRVRARALRAPVLLGLLTCQTGRCAPLAHGSFAASYSAPKNNYFQKQIASLLAQTRAAKGVYLSTGLSCTY
jgi:hypothetical protein